MTTNPPGPDPIWEDFEGDFAELKGTVTPPKKSWKKWIVLSSCGVALLAGGIGGWLYFANTKGITSDNSEYSSSGSESIDQLRENFRLAERSPKKLIAVLNSAIETSKKYEILNKAQTANDGATSSEDELHEFEAVLIGLQVLLKLDLEKLIANTPENKNFLKNSLDQLGVQQFTYKSNKLTEQIPLLQSAWIEDRIEHLKASFASQRHIDEMEDILEIVRNELSHTTAGAAFQLGLWFRYKNQPKLAEIAFQVTQRYVDGYHADSTYYPGYKPESFSPLWSEYVGALEGLASISFNQKLYRQARSYILRMFNTPSNTDISYVGSEQGEVKVIKTRIEEVQKDIKILNKALKAPENIPTHPLFSEAHDWVINWTKLSEALRKNSFYSKKDIVAQTLWEEISPSLRSEILLHTGINWATKENRSKIIHLLNQLVKDPSFKEKLLKLEATDQFIKLSDAFPKSGIENLKHINTQVLNRKILDLAFGSEDYFEFVLQDGTSLNQTLSPEQTRDYIHFLKLDLTRADSQEEKSRINSIIQGLTSQDSPTTIIDLKNYLIYREKRTQKAISHSERIYTSQEKQLVKLQEEIRSLEKMDTLDTEAVIELKQNELVIKKNQLAQKFQIEKAMSELKSIEDLKKNLLNSFKQILFQKEAKLAQLIKQYNQIKDQTFENNFAIAQSLEEIINAHIELKDALDSLPQDLKKTDIHELQTSLDTINSELAYYEKQLNDSSGNEATELIQKIRLTKEKQKKKLSEIFSFSEPIRILFEKIVEKEKAFWLGSDNLRAVRKEIADIMGKDGKIGSLQKMVDERSNLLLTSSDQVIRSPEINERIVKLNESIENTYTQLSLLVQKEKSLRNSISRFFPKFYEEHRDKNSTQQIDLLSGLLKKQENLLEGYELLWKTNDLLGGLEIQENNMIDALQHISKHILDAKSLSENEVYDLERAISSFIDSGNRREEIYRELAALKTGTQISTTADDGRGFYLDSAKFFEIESKIGIEVSHYQKVFSTRDILVDKILSLTLDAQKLQEQQKEASEINDQLLIDQVTPKLTRVNALLQNLSDKQLKINEEIYEISKEYLKKIHLSKDNRKKFFLTENESHKNLQKIQQDLDKNDDLLFSAADTVSANLTQINSLLDSLDLSNITDIESFKHQIEQHIGRFLGLQAHLQKENFFKVKALWLLGLTYFEQSKLSSFLEVKQANFIPEFIQVEERVQNTIIFDEFKPDLSYQKSFSKPSEEALEEGSEDFEYSNWVLFSEKSALRVFDEIIPRYLSSSSFQIGNDRGLNSVQKEDLYLFYSEAKLLSGSIHLKRALNQLKPESSYEPSKKLAYKFLNDAIHSLKEYVDLIAPNGHMLNFSKGEVSFSTNSPFPFIHNKKVSDRLSEAQVLLSECYFLKDDYQSSIASLKTFLNNILEKDPIYQAAGRAADDYIGNQYKIRNENFQYQVGLDPFYTSLLSANPYSQSALFLLAHNYEVIALREKSRLDRTIESNPQYKASKVRFEEYSRQALAYYSQLINSQIYSPLRKVATLQRASVWNLLDNYESARSDLISLLDSSGSPPPTASVQEVRFIRDLPQIQFPSKSHVLMELGKLYFEHGDYEAASETFNEAADAESMNKDRIFEAKASFANSMFARKDWVRACYLYRELIRDHEDAGLGSYLSHAPNLLISYGKTLKAIANYSDAVLTFQKVFTFAPPELIDNDKLNLSNPYGIEILRSSYRDSIRPLMLASFYRGEIFALKKEFDKAASEFEIAKALVPYIPWKEDSELRFVSKKDFHDYISKWSLKTKWELQKLKANELFHSSFAKNQKLLNEAPEKLSLLNLNSLITKVRASVSDYRKDRELFEDLYKKLTNFKTEQLSLTPSFIQEKQMIKHLEEERALLTPNFQRFQALKTIRAGMEGFSHLKPSSFIAELLALFPKGSYEYKVSNEFALEFGESLRLTSYERNLMNGSLNNLENLLTIPNLNERGKSILQAFQSWMSGELSKTKLDVTYIPVDPEQAILTEVDLYRAAALSYIDTPSSIKQLKELGMEYLKKSYATPNRIINPEGAWNIIEVAAQSAFNHQDWETSKALYQFVLDKENTSFFTFPNKWDQHQAELAYSESLIQLSTEQLKESVFMSEGNDKADTLRMIDEERKIAYDTLTKLQELTGSDAVSNLVRVRAKELLREIKI